MTSTVEVTTWHLEMLHPGELKEVYSRGPVSTFEARRALVPSPELNRFLYTAVGADWYWVDRLSWTYAAWLDYLKRPEVETWVAWVEGNPAGYFELEAQAEEAVEIAYFGILPQFTGQGIGGRLLSDAIRRAWELAGRRVWVHTCSLDHPAALKNYLARGFQVFKTETALKSLPALPLEAWRGR